MSAVTIDWMIRIVGSLFFLLTGMIGALGIIYNDRHVNGHGFWAYFKWGCFHGFFTVCTLTLFWTSFLVIRNPTEYRLKKEGKIVACPTCGHDMKK